MAVSVKVSKEGLQIIDKARKRKGWTATASAWCEAAEVSVSTLKRLRLCKNIRQDYFINICKVVEIQNWESLIDEQSEQNLDKSKNSNINFFAYDDKWVGRNKLLVELKEKANNCRIIMITGITGIGKTALAERLILELQSEPLYSSIRILIANFDDQTQAADFSTVATQWLQEMGENINFSEQNNHQLLLDKLLNQVLNNRYIIFMDSLEEILEGNQEKGWNNFQDIWWVNFFESLLKAQYCQSLIILTSQDLPVQIQVIGNKYPNVGNCHTLTGLTQPEQLDLFKKIGLEIDDNVKDTNYLKRIGAAYEGHPLALKIIAGEIGNKPFYGNVTCYWHKHGQEIEKVEKAIAEAKTKISSKDDDLKIHNYNYLLKRSVEIRLFRTLERLEKDVKVAYVLLCETSVYRRSVPEKLWLNHLSFWDFQTYEKENALDILRDRYLIEEDTNQETNEYLVRQHNLIRSISLERLKKLEQNNE